MGAFFIKGEQKVRPGVYKRYEDWGNPPVAGADDGKSAATVRSNWGPVGTAVTLEKDTDITKYFGSGGENGTTDCPLLQFKGGSKLVYAVRLGNGGTQGALEISDSEGAAVLKLVLKYPGSRAFHITIRPTLADAAKKELLILEGTKQLEKIEFAAGGNESAALLAAYAESGSDYFTLSAIAESESELVPVEQAAITPGTDPVITADSYSKAFEILEGSRYRWNCIAIDTDDVAIQMLLQSFLNRIYSNGKAAIGFIGEPTSVDFETRLVHASAYNDYQIVYVGNGYTDLSGAVYEGWKAAAFISGLVAGTPSDQSITHTAITGAVDLTEILTNNQYERAIKAGMLTFSVSSANTVWVEQGINTLVLPKSTDDAGWKKIKRVKVRFELFQRIDDTVEPQVGRLNNDDDGRKTVVQICNSVCNSMVAEKKLLTGAHVEEDPDNPPQGDSAWFLVYADDVDSLEKMYFTYKFRFAPDTESA